MASAIASDWGSISGSDGSQQTRPALTAAAFNSKILNSSTAARIHKRCLGPAPPFERFKAFETCGCHGAFLWPRPAWRAASVSGVVWCGRVEGRCRGARCAYHSGFAGLFVVSGVPTALRLLRPRRIALH
jgi:hypothetical protein